jgi:hypothetical protein
MNPKTEDNDEIIDLAAGETTILKRFWLRRRLKNNTKLHQTEKLFADLKTLASEPTSPTHAIDFAMEATQFPNDSNNRKKYQMIQRMILPTLSVAALLTVAALPISHGIVQSQLKLVFGGMSRMATSMSSDALSSGDATLRAEHPNDYELELALALQAPGATYSNPAPIIAALRALVPRYPDRPELRALILNGMLETYSSAGLRGKLAKPDAKRPSVIEITEALSDAEAGERLAPNNMLFPLLHAAILQIAGNRDNEAVIKFQLAATKSEYQDYRAAMSRAQIHLTDLRNSGLTSTNALGKLAVFAASTISGFNHLPGVTGSLAIDRAIAAELAGDATTGLMLREAMLIIGSKMTTEAGSISDNLASSRLAVLAGSRPGGVPAITTKFEGTDAWAKSAAMTLERFTPYAKKQNRPDLTEKMASVIQRRLQQVAIWNKTSNEGINIAISGLAWWFGAMAFLVWALWMVLCGGIAYKLNQTARVREAKPLHPAVGWGIPLSVALPMLIALGVNEIGGLIAPALTLLLLGGVGWHLARTKNGSANFFGNAKVFGLTLLLSLAMIAASGYLLSGAAFFSSAMGGNVHDGRQLAAVGVMAAGMALGFPMVVVIGLSLWSLKKRLPASVGIVRGLRKLAVPVACLLLIVYAVLAPIAAHHDQRSGAVLEDFSRHEGRSLARLTNATWP